MWVSFDGHRDYIPSPSCYTFSSSCLAHAYKHSAYVAPVMKCVSAHKVWCIVTRVQYHISDVQVLSSPIVHVLIYSSTLTLSYACRCNTTRGYIMPLLCDTVINANIIIIIVFGIRYAVLHNYIAKYTPIHE